MANHSHFRVSWSDFQRDTRLLVPDLKKRQSWKGIVAITRGGLIPSAIIAHDLDIRFIETACIASYNDDASQSSLRILKQPSGDGKDFIVMDDLTDSGQTFHHIRQILPQAYCVTVYAKPKGEGLVDAFGKKIDQDQWIIFPWEE